MADVDGGGPLSPNPEIAGVSATLRLRFDRASLQRDLQDTRKMLRTEMGEFSKIAAEGLGKYQHALSAIGSGHEAQVDRLLLRLKEARTLQAQINSAANTLNRSSLSAGGVRSQTAGTTGSNAAALQAQRQQLAAQSALDRQVIQHQKQATQQQAVAFQQHIKSQRQQLAQQKLQFQQQNQAQRQQLAAQTQINRQATTATRGGIGLGTIAGGSLIGNLGANAITGALRGATQNFEKLVGSVIAFNANIETASVGIRQFTKNGEQAKTLVDSLIKFAVTSPFGIPQVLEGAKRLLAMGIAADKVLPSLRTLSSAVAAVGGNQQIFNRVILAFGQIAAKAKLSAQDLRQLSEAGIPAFKILQEELGLTSEEVFNIGHAAIDSRKGVEALLRGMDKRFAAGLILQMDTLTGRFRNFNDVFQLFTGKLGEGVNPQLKQALKDLADILQDPGNLAAAQAFGEVVGNLVKSLRENLFSDTGGLIAWIQGLPTTLAAAGVEITKFQNLLENFRGLDLNIDGRPILNFGSAPELNREIDNFFAKVQAEADKAAKEGAAQSKITIGITAQIDIVRTELARNKVTGIEAENVIDLTGFSEGLADEAEIQMTRGLTAGGAKSVENFLSFLDKALGADKESGRAVGHIAAQLRETYVKELAALGDNPSVEKVKAAAKRLTESLSIPTQFGESAIAKDVQSAAAAFFSLGQEQERLVDIQQSLQEQQAANKVESDKEERGIESKTKAVKELTASRKAEHDAAELQIQPLKDEQFDLTRDKRLRDIEFDRRFRDEQASTARLHDLLDPVTKSIELAHDAAANRLEDLQTKQSNLSDSWKIINQNQARIERDLQDRRSVDEGKYTKKIDAAADAEKRHASVIKTANLDLRESLRTQDELIDKIDDKYRAELRVKDLLVDDQSDAIKAAQSEQNKRDLEFAKAIAAARSRGDKDEVARLREQRDASRIAFEESQEVARAELQVRQDAAELLADTATEETRNAKEKREDIQRTGQASLDRLAREGDALEDNRAKIEAERDTALSSYDRKIAIAKAFAELLGRSQQDQEAIASSELKQAQALETSTQRRLEAQQASDKLVFDNAGAREKTITNEKKLFDEAQGDKLEKLSTEIERIERIDELAGRNAEKRIGEAQAEVDKATELHKEHDLIRAGDELRTKTLETQTSLRITELQKEADRLQGLLDLYDTYKKTATVVSNEAIPASTGDVAAINTRKQIQDIINRQPNQDRRDLQATIVAAQREFERTGDQKAFNDIARQLLVLLGEAGLGSLTAVDISDFLHRPEPKKILVNVDPAVIELLAAIKLAGKGSAIGKFEAGRLLESDDIVEKLVRAVAGTDTLAGSKAVQTALEALLPVLRGIDPTVAAELTKQLKARGVGFDPVTGEIGVDEKLAQADALVMAGPGLQEAATQLKEAAALLKAEGSREAQGGGTIERAIETAAAILFPDKDVFGNRGILNFNTNTLKDALTNNTRTSAISRDEILNVLKEILNDPKRKQELIAAIQANPEDFRLVFSRLFEGDYAHVFNKTLDAQLNKPVRDALDQLIKDAEVRGKQIPPKLRDGIEEGAAGGGGGNNVAAAVNSNIVKPASDEFAKIPGAAAAAIDKTLGPDGLGKLESEESKTRIDALGGAASDALVLAARKALGLDDGGENKFGVVASDAVGDKGLGAISSEKSLSAIDKATKAASAAFLASFKAGVNKGDKEGGELSLASIATTAAQNYLEAFKQKLILDAEGVAAAGMSALAQALADRAPQLPNNFKEPNDSQGVGGQGLLNPVKGAFPIKPGFGFTGSHKALDLNAPNDMGSEIRAAADGVVSRVSFPNNGDTGRRSDNSGYGNMIIIDHLNGYSTLYAHLSGTKGPRVKVGQNVKRGQVIAYMGDTGKSTGSHLHFEVIANKSNERLDPTKFFEGGSQASKFQSTANAGSGGLLGDTANSRPTDRRSAAVQLIQGLIEGVEEAGGDFQVVLDAFLSGATSLTEERLKGFSKFAKDEMKVAFEALTAALEMLGGGNRQQLADALKAAGLDLSAIGQDEDGIPGLDAPQLAGKPRINDGIAAWIAELRKFILDAPRTTEGERDPQIERLLNTLFDASPTALLSEIVAEFEAQLAASETGISPGLAALLEQIRGITSNAPGIFAQDLQGLLFGKGEGFQQKQIEAVESNTEMLHLATLVIAESAGIGAEQLAELRQQVKIWQRLEAEWEQIADNTGATAEATGETAENTEKTAGAADATAANTGTTAANTAPPVVPPPPMSEEMKKAIVAGFGQLFPEQAGTLDGSRSNLNRGEFGFPEEGMRDFADAFGDGTKKGLDGFRDSLKSSEDGRQKIIDELGKNLRGTQEVQITVQDKLIASMVAEMAARNALVAVLQGKPPVGATPLPVPPGGGSVGGVGSGGGGGVRAQGTQIFNLFESNDPRFTANQIAQQSVWAQRMGGG